jgi:DNA-binding CsgD family transcriptional regulator
LLSAFTSTMGDSIRTHVLAHHGQHAPREVDVNVRCGTAVVTGTRTSRTSGSISAWNLWASVSQSAVTDNRAAPADRQSLTRAAEEAQRDLLAATEAAEQALARARALTWQLERALEALHASEATSRITHEGEHSASWARLSSREREVLALVAEGRSNKAIAEALFVSPNTVKTHVASLLTKFDVDSRVQLAALAASHANWQDAA